jgi:integrase/recombinase XerD
LPRCARVGCSVSTERVYAGRPALYLSLCRMRRLDWKVPDFRGLTGWQKWLVTEPLPARSTRPGRDSERQLLGDSV